MAPQVQLRFAYGASTRPPRRRAVDPFGGGDLDVVRVRQGRGRRISSVLHSPSMVSASTVLGRADRSDRRRDPGSVSRWLQLSNRTATPVDVGHQGVEIFVAFVLAGPDRVSESVQDQGVGPGADGRDGGALGLAAHRTQPAPRQA